MSHTKSLLRLFLILFSLLAISANLYAQRCQATTKKGTQCKRNAVSGSIYCWQHKPMYEKESAKKQTAPVDTNKHKIKPTEKPKSESAYRQCQATTKKGKQCSRRAEPGSNYCWQHKR